LPPLAADDVSAYFVAPGFGELLVFTPPSTTARTIDGGRVAVRALTTHGSAVYIAGQDYSTPAGDHGAIVRVAKTGAARVQLLSLAGLPNDIAVDDHAIFWLESSPYGTFDIGHLARADLDGSHPMALAMTDASSLALDEEYVYFVDDGLHRVPKAGGAEETLVPGLEGASLLRIAGADATWVNLATKALSDARPSELMALCLRSGDDNSGHQN
jgi:hypothetical protein